VQPSAQTNAILRARLEELLGEYERARGGLERARAAMRTMRGRAETTDRTIVVAVDAQGRLSTLEIDPRAYRRFSPSQLAEEIVALTQQAVADVTSQVGEVMAPFLPAGVPLADVVSGKADLGDYLPKQPPTGDTFEDWRDALTRPPDGPQP
jgi:hypothetical protein